MHSQQPDMHSQRSNASTRSQPSAVSRRTALETLAGLSITVIAGCTGGPSDSNRESPTTTVGLGVIDEVRVDGLQLVVELAQPAESDQINVIEPSGELFAQQSVETGVQTVTFELGTNYNPGEFRILALQDDETVGEGTLTIQPEWEITEFGIGANNSDEMPEGLGLTADSAAFLTVENNGIGPDAINKLLILGDVPNPTTELANSNSVSGTGIWLPDEKTIFDALVFEPGTSRRIFTDTTPFAFLRDGNIICQSTPQSGTFEVILETSVAGRETATYAIEYSAADEYDQCSMTVLEAEQ